MYQHMVLSPSQETEVFRDKKVQLIGSVLRKRKPPLHVCFSHEKHERLLLSKKTTPIPGWVDI